ncbi:MAG: CDP-glucose 4,6-dehydratase [Bacteroidota bacterium]
MQLFNNIYADKRVLITGDTGFKGSWLAIWLKELGADVFGYALPPQRKEDNFIRCGLGSHIRHKDGDIRDFNIFLEYVKEIQPDIAFHLAAQPIVLESYQNPKYTFETNIIGKVNFFDAVRAVPSIKAALNITSDKCYQNNEWIWGYRENDPMGGKDPYSASKGCSELVTSAYMNSFFQKEHTAAIASVRAGNVIGGGDWAAYRIVPDFFRSIKAKEPIVLRNPHATRPWQFVLEPLSGYLQLASLLYREGKQYSGGWNFGPGITSEHTVEELVQAILRLYGSGSIQLETTEEKLHEASLLRLDISKAITLLNWKPVLQFDELVKITVDGYRDDLKNTSLYDQRANQLADYVQLTQDRKIVWACE